MQSVSDGIEPTPVIAAVLEPKESPQAKRGTRWERLVAQIWDPDFVEKSPAERAFIFKLDCYMLASLTLGWWIKNQDQSNLANAYVSGMKEDLNINGNQYTYMLTIYNAVVCVMCLPANFIVFKLRPSIFLPISEIGWGVFTFAQAGAKTYQQMYVFRFFVAFFEGFFYPLAFFILGSWYTKRELAKRMGLWFVAGPAGSAFSGYLQAAVYKNLDGHAGLAGWRWLFVVCGGMTIPSGAILFFLLPDFPANTRIWYLTESQKELARERSLSTGLKPIGKTISWKSAAKALRHWRFWVLVPTYAIYGLAVQNAVQFGIFLKSEHYSVTERNVYPSGTYLLQIGALLTYTYLSDRFGSRFWPTLLPVIWGLVPTGILAVWPKSVKLKVFAFMVNSTFYITPVFIAWASEICKDSVEERALIIGAMPALFYCINAWLPTIIFRQTDGPSFRKGFPTNFAFTATCAILFVVVRILHNRQLKEEADAAESLDLEQAGPSMASAEKEGKDTGDGDIESK